MLMEQDEKWTIGKKYLSMEDYFSTKLLINLLQPPNYISEGIHALLRT
jgi:hypothetical protein